ncbi:hypothetical protein D0860_01872 [Hortaea werneckii]|uniref:Uncharacterized protein n=1 Tax=Hortaea werneckii TaxID=91943 RepID=A0A3M7HP50_HORWE|nr:hypothetical protein D0860_01872 [Hortaea werneckii]
MQSTRFLAGNMLRAQPSRMTPMLRTQQATRGFRTVGRQMRPMPPRLMNLVLIESMYRKRISPVCSAQRLLHSDLHLPQWAPQKQLTPTCTCLGKQWSARAEHSTDRPLLLRLAHTISQRLRQLKRIPPELIPLGVVLAAAVFAAGYSIVRKLFTDSTLRLYRQGPDANKH